VSWTRVAALDDLWPGERKRVVASGAPILLVRIDDEIVAWADRCPHQGVPLSEGTIDGRALVCRAHRWEFDVCSGEGRNPRGVHLRRVPVRIASGDVLVEITAGTREAPRPPTPVGPVLRAGRTADALVAAIHEQNDDVSVLDRGSYVRVTAPGSCRVTRDAVERHLGAPFHLPGDLEIVMPSFEGRLALDDDSATWSSRR
jgi:toluene monooxygenase system ferredoxin subunit